MFCDLKVTPVYLMFININNESLNKIVFSTFRQQALSATRLSPYQKLFSFFQGCSVDAIIRTAVANNCDPSFSVSSMDDRSFEPGSWERAVGDTSKSADPWKYHPMTETGALPYAGRYTTYPGMYLQRFSSKRRFDHPCISIVGGKFGWKVTTVDALRPSIDTST